MKRQVIDMDLINKAKNGYQGAYTALFNYYYTYLFNYINCIVHNDADAEDLVMVTFEKAFIHLNKYAPLFNFKTWLSKIARNSTIDFIRFKKYNPCNNCIDIEYLSQFKSNIENPEKEIIIKEETDRYKLIIKSMNPAFREIYIRRTLGFRCREIAIDMDTSINTVVGRLRYIKLKFAV
jgi:RNA polymerase sigma-70 factor (ECF subfamily)